MLRSQGAAALVLNTPFEVIVSRKGGTDACGALWTHVSHRKW